MRKQWTQAWAATMVFMGAVLLFFAPVCLVAQTRPMDPPTPPAAAADAGTPVGRLHGRVTDNHSGAGVAGAVVRVTAPPQDASLGRQARTGADGAFMFDSLPGGELRVTVTHPGYVPASVRVGVPVGSAVVLELPLEPRPLQLGIILVDGERGNAAYAGENIHDDGSAVGRRFPTLLQLRPFSAGGLGDLVLSDAAAEHQADPTSGRRPHALHFRGSGVTRGRVTLDGASINAPLHLGAILPPLDPEVLESARLWSAGAPAAFDGGTAYILDLTSRAPASDEPTMRGELDLLVTRVSSNLHAGDGAGVVIGARQVNTPLIEDVLGRPFGYGYGDVLARGEAAGPGHGRLTATALLTREWVRLRRDQADQVAGWRNAVATASWRREGPREPSAAADSNGSHRSRIVLAASFSRGIAELPLLTALGAQLRATADHAAVSADRQWTRGGTALRAGAELEHVQFSQLGSITGQAAGGTRPARPTSGECSAELPCGRVSASTLATHATAAWQPGGHGTVAAGGRLLFEPSSGRVVLLPRMETTLVDGGSVAISVAAGRFSQRAAAGDNDIRLVLAWRTELTAGLWLGPARAGARIFVRRDEADAEEVGFTAPGAEFVLVQMLPTGTFSLGYSLLGRPAAAADTVGTSSHGAQLQQMATIGVSTTIGPATLNINGSWGSGLPITSIVLERPPEYRRWPDPRNVPSEPPTGLHGGSGRDLRSGGELGSFVRMDAQLGVEWLTGISGRPVRIAPYGRVLSGLSRRDAIFYFTEAGVQGAPQPLASLPLLPILGVRFQF